jgi:DNA-directed RNA polymerase specialized sigma24 family protein
MAADREWGRTYSCAEIAEACGCTAGAIRVIEGKALAKLRHALKRAGFEKVELDPA